MEKHDWYKNENAARKKILEQESEDVKRYGLDDVREVIDRFQARKKILRDALEADDAWNYRTLHRVIYDTLKRVHEGGYPSAFLVFLGENSDEGGNILGMNAGPDGPNDDGFVEIAQSYLEEVGVPKDYLTVVRANLED